MTQRLDYNQIAPSGAKALGSVYGYVMQSSLPPWLVHLVYLRISQINNCAFCIDMHAREARKGGETEERIYLLNAWRESPHYTPRERAALVWTEALTLVAETHAPDADYEALKAHFTDEEIAQLTMRIVVINGWNRLSVGFNVWLDPAVARAANKAAA